RSKRAQPAAVATITDPTENIAVVIKRCTPPGKVKVWMTNIAKIPNAAAPPTGANHSSVGADENCACAGSSDTTHTEAKPVVPSTADTPQRGAAVIRTGHVSAKVTTSADMTTGPVSAGRLGKNAVNTANTVAAATAVKAEIVLRTSLSCHVGLPDPRWQTVPSRDLTGTVIVVALLICVCLLLPKPSVRFLSFANLPIHQLWSTRMNLLAIKLGLSSMPGTPG